MEVPDPASFCVPILVPSPHPALTFLLVSVSFSLLVSVLDYAYLLVPVSVSLLVLIPSFFLSSCIYPSSYLYLFLVYYYLLVSDSFSSRPCLCHLPCLPPFTRLSLPSCLWPSFSAHTCLWLPPLSLFQPLTSSLSLYPTSLLLLLVSLPNLSPSPCLLSNLPPPPVSYSTSLLFSISYSTSLIFPVSLPNLSPPPCLLFNLSPPPCLLSNLFPSPCLLNFLNSHYREALFSSLFVFMFSYDYGVAGFPFARTPVTKSKTNG